MQKQDLLTDEYLVHRIRHGCDQSFRKLYIRYFEQMCEISYRYVKRKDLAKDIAQEAMINAYQNINKLKKDACFEAWLRRIAVNRSLDLLRNPGERTVDPLEIELPDQNPDEMVSQEEKYVLFEKTLSSLGSDDQALLLMKYRDHISIRELSDLWQTSESAIKMRLKRIRDRVRTKVEVGES